MKKLVIAITLAAAMLTGCADTGSLTYQRRVGDGKGYVALTGNSVSFGYRRSLPVPPAKGVVQPESKPGWIQKFGSLFM